MVYPDLAAQAREQFPLTPSKKAAEGTLPPMADNDLKPLSDYSPTLYRETNLEELANLAPNTRNYFEGRELYFANTPDLALGQGTNKGVLIRFKSDGIQGQVNTSKPNWDFVYQQGQAELIGKYINESTLKNNIESVTIKAGAKGDRVSNARVKFMLENWNKTSNPDGSVTYIPPSKPEVLKDYPDLVTKTGPETQATEESRLKDLEFGTKEVSLPIKEDFSDYLTLRDEVSRLEDGLYTAGDNYVYSVKNHKIEVLPQYRSRFDFGKNKYVYTERTLTPTDITQVPIFHGSVHKGLSIKDLTLERSGQNFSGVGGNEFEGIYFTTRPSDAKGYASLGKEGGTLLEGRISPQAKVIKYNEVGNRDTSQLLKDGVDVVLKYGKGGDFGEVVILNPKVLLSPETSKGATPPIETIPTEKTKPKEELGYRGKESFTAEGLANLEKALSELSEGMKDILKDDVRIIQIPKEELEKMPPELKSQLRFAKAVTWNKLRINIPEGSMVDATDIAHELVHLKYYKIPDEIKQEAEGIASDIGKRIVTFANKRKHENEEDAQLAKQAKRHINEIKFAKDRNFAHELSMAIPPYQYERIAKRLGIPVKDEQYLNLAVNKYLDDTHDYGLFRGDDVEEFTAYLAGTDEKFREKIFPSARPRVTPSEDKEEITEPILEEHPQELILNEPETVEPRIEEVVAEEPVVEEPQAEPKVKAEESEAEEPVTEKIAAAPVEEESAAETTEGKEPATTSAENKETEEESSEEPETTKEKPFKKLPMQSFSEAYAKYQRGQYLKEHPDINPEDVEIRPVENSLEWETWQRED